MKKYISFIILFVLSLQAFSQSPDTLTPEKKARYKIGRIRDNSVRAITPKDFRDAFGALANLTVKRVPYLTQAELRSGSADTAAVVQVVFNGRAWSYRYDNASVASDDSAKTLVTFSGRRYVLNDAYRPELWQTTGDGVTDDSKAFRKAVAAIGKGTLTITAGKIYYIDSVFVNNNYITIRGESGSTKRFATAGYSGGAAILKHKAGSTNPMLVMNQGGQTLEGLFLDGNGAPGTILKIAHGFEMRMRTIRIAHGTGIGLDIAGSNNTYYEDIFVDNCGSIDLPAVRIRTEPPRTINTLHFYGLTIERSPGVHLDINTETNPEKNYPEFLYFSFMHIEAVSDNGGIANTQPLIKAGNFRQLFINNSFLVGGEGKFFEHKQTDGSYINILGGTVITNSSLQGRNLETGHQPDTLIHLIKGGNFKMSDCIVDNALAGTYAIVIDSIYYGRVQASQDQNLTKRIGNWIKDNRITIQDNTLNGRLVNNGDLLLNGHLRTGANLALTAVGEPQGAGSSANGRPVPIITGNDMAGTIFFGTGSNVGVGALCTVTFAKPYTVAPKGLTLLPGNAASAALRVYRSVTTTGFTIYSIDTPTASAPVTTYQFSYTVKE